MLTYFINPSHLKPEHLVGFFVGWPTPPSSETLCTLLNQAPHTAVVCDQLQVVGFTYAISDGLLSAYIPLLEVLPEYQGQGIGQTLIRKLTAEMSHIYMLDICCDLELTSFYEAQGFHSVRGMIKRNYTALNRL